MSTFAESDAPRRRRSRPARGGAGFTLLEVLVTLAMVSVAAGSLLVIRDATWNIAYRSGHMLKAANYAETILAEHMTDPDDMRDHQAVIEDDPAFHYELTIESYDLSTGRVDEPEDQDVSTTSNFSAQSAFMPPDAAAAPEDVEDLYKDPQHVRRFRLKVMYPSLEDEKEGEYLLEGYLPMAKKEKDDAVPAAPTK